MNSQPILIIDEEEAVRESLHLVLNEEGFQCLAAESDINAKKILLSEPIAVVVIDSHLLGSKSFLQFLKENTPQVRIIIMSTYAEVDVTQKALLAGAHDFVIKPLNFKELIDKIKFQLSILSQ
ncbi:response regulator [Fodinibius halophilus]|uniref:Response regulator n=1 Tax=Fodinibius halophilus TaxID=1736908 RepID=A0A6M1SSY5_9BACT|nr:response regulator [Fodinibius halophilus]NGP87048.1 response regulator [Fodinibius halophilus]